MQRFQRRRKRLIKAFNFRKKQTDIFVKIKGISTAPDRDINMINENAEKRQQKNSANLKISVFSRSIGVYQHSRDTACIVITLNKAILRTKSGRNGLDEKTRYCHTLASTDPKAYREWKADNLPAVTFSGKFSYREAKHLKQHSGLATLDIDGLNPADRVYLLSQLTQIADGSQMISSFSMPEVWNV